MRTAINMNEHVRVELTPAGFVYLQDHGPCNYRIVGKQYEFQFYELMRVFGKYMIMGVHDIPFKHNEMIYGATK